MNYKKVDFAIPNSIDISLLKKSFSKKDCQKAYYVINLLVHMHARFPDAIWLRFHSKLLTYFLGNYYTSILKKLEELKIIEIENSWMTNNYSKGYRLLFNNLENGRYIRCNDNILANKILLFRNKKHLDDKLKASTSDVDKWLFNILSDVDIAIPSYLLEENQFDNLKRVRNNEAVMAIKSGDIDYTICDYGRRHTPITRLSKKNINIRSFIKFKSSINNNLVEIDISNSQVIFLIAELQKTYLYDEINFFSESSIENYIFNSYNSKKREGITGVPLCTQFDKKIFYRLKEDAENGIFYDKMQKALGYEDRQAMKKDVFRFILFGKIWKISDSSNIEPKAKLIISYFINEYPGILECINVLKAKDYRDLARQMQRSESDLMFSGVIPKIINLIPNARILTIHDSIICEKEHQDKIIKIIYDEFSKIGMRPSLKINNLIESDKEETDSEIISTTEDLEEIRS